ncbi:MAG TPA: type II secretion system F family protein [Verrucomicrobiota bacterium]|nr:type II secretion system F family protein [Verrucomicrobiota bacterium]HRZ35115.1 type II secretion system F family protein [Candidatus Paceibacterota bacterium]HRZ56234.1 type II secretion system F family protein [Candidatus Paceibacterota bacterium]
MPQFTYKARRRSGELVQDVVEANDRPSALVQIERLGLFPVMVESARGSGAGRAERSAGRARPSAALLPPALRELLQRKRRPKLQELATFTQQLTNLLRAGMPLASALNSMSYLGTKGIPPEVSRQLKQDVMEGKGLSDGMAKQPVIFSDLYVNMVRAGEQSGALGDVLQRMATHFERFAEVQHKFTSALIYPAVVCCVGVLIMIFFMTFMLPRFMTIFDGMKMELPAATKFLVGLSRFFSGYWWTIPLVAAALLIIYNRYKATEAGRRAIDRFKMNAPVFGKVVRLNLFGQFARTLGTLLQNGVPVLTALKITEQVMPNRMVREAIAHTREEVTDGKTIAQPLARSKLFPQLMIDLIRIGEETGDVPGALNNVAQTYENELSIALRVMTNLIEPAMIIVMALGVGFLLFSVLSAMFAITANIAR